MSKTVNRLAKTTLEQKEDSYAPIVQVQYLSQTKNAVHAAPYGIHSSPEINTPCLLITINNDPANAYVFPLSFEEKKKVNKIKKGEVIVGNFNKKASILFDQDGNITLSCQQNIIINANNAVNVNCKNINVSASNDVKIESSGGDINISSSNIVLGTNTTIDNKLFLQHTHSGVTTGTGDTGPVV